jgi:hypothetical protein
MKGDPKSFLTYDPAALVINASKDGETLKKLIDFNKKLTEYLRLQIQQNTEVAEERETIGSASHPSRNIIHIKEEEEESNEDQVQEEKEKNKGEQEEQKPAPAPSNESSLENRDTYSATMRNQEVSDALMVKE